MNSSYYAEGKHSYMRYDTDAFPWFIYSQIEPLLPKQHERALEFGAGMGRFSAPLVSKFKSVHLVEPTPGYAELLKRRFQEDRVNIHTQDASSFIASNKIHGPSTLFCFHLMHHLSQSDRKQIYAYIKASASIGVFVEPNPINPLILLQILLNRDMHFADENQYLELGYRKYSNELGEIGLPILTYRRFCVVPPFFGDWLLAHGADRVVRAIEATRSILPLLCSYQLLIVGQQPGESRC